MKPYASLLSLTLLVGCVSTDRPVAEAATVARPVRRAFDVPALLGLNAEQTSQSLASQAVQTNRDRTPRESPAGELEARNTYWRDTTALVVSYDPHTMRVLSFFVKTQRGLTSDYQLLLQAAGISTYDKRFMIEPIASVVSPQFYTGVRLVPRQPTPTPK